MKKLICLVCFFIFVFLSFSNNVLADGPGVKPSELATKYQEKLNISSASEEYLFFVTYVEEDNEIGVMFLPYDEGSDVIVPFNLKYDSNNNSISLENINNEVYDYEYIDLLIKSILELLNFPDEYYAYLNKDFLMKLNFDSHGFEMKENDDEVSELKIELGALFSDSLLIEIENLGSFEEDGLNIIDVAEAYESYLKENEDNDYYNVDEVIFDQAKSQLIVFIADSDENYVFDYDLTNNVITYSEENFDTDTEYIYFVDALETIIVEMNGYAYIDWENVKKDIDETELTLENDGYYWNVDEEMNFTFKINLGTTFKNTLENNLGALIEGPDNPVTSDIRLINIILIGGLLLLIAGYGTKKLKKIK